MKIYSGNKNLINRTVNIYGAIVKFDRTCSAELSKEDAEMILKKAPNAYSSEPIVVEEETKEDTKSDDEIKIELEIAKEKIEKLKIQDISRKKKLGEKDVLIKELGKNLDAILAKKEELEFKISGIKNTREIDAEDWKSKYELALKGLTELKLACKTLEIPEEKWKEIKSEDKFQIIDLIIQETKE